MKGRTMKIGSIKIGPMKIESIALMFLSFLFLIPSCDILRNSPYVVEAWTPGEGFHENPGRLKVSLLFSNASDKAKTEQAFSLTEDGKTLKGYFSWEGSRLVFTPASPLEADRNYFITLGTGAQDTNGLSLEHRFEASFTTRTPGEKPRITRSEPEYEGSLSESRGEFRLFFSEPVSRNSCIDYISFSPATPGSWRLEDGDKTACFVPREPWQTGSTFQVRVESAFPGRSGSVLGTEYSSVFYVTEDREKPVLLKVLALLPPGEADGALEEEIPFESPGHFLTEEYSAWEKSSRLCLVFSKPVDVNSLRNFIVTEPSLTLILESAPEMASRAVFRFAEYPAWGSSFLFRLTPGVKDFAGNESSEEYAFRIKAAGPLSKPPALVGIRLPMSPGSVNQEVLSFSPGDLFADLPIQEGEDRYPFGKQTSAWIELYFETAPDTEIDTFSLMDMLRVEATNQALEFLPGSIRARDFTIAAPREGWEDLQRFEIRGSLINKAHTGIVTFRIPPGLKDKRGNRSDVDFRISLSK